MRQRLFRFALLLAGAATLAVAAAATAGPNGSGNATMCVLNTQLRAENEPPVLSTASGHAQIKVRNNGTVEFNVFIRNPDEETFVGGHVHVKPTGAPVVLLFGGETLFGGPPISETHIRQRGELGVAAALAAALCNNPAAYYVNYHTTQDLPGAIRGELG